MKKFTKRYGDITRDNNENLPKGTSYSRILLQTRILNIRYSIRNLLCYNNIVGSVSKRVLKNEQEADQLPGLCWSRRRS